ncbi:STAS domain-containing protein [Methylomonas sp. AM2-LC]|uniref:STAS domain-containing protein n=1 Tax=Methylomonas sp. AM2-LC TaxID=3153301 RepID=UPI003263870B
MQSLAINDELTIFTATEQKKHLLAFLQTDDELEVNLANVSEIDTAGLQLLILLKREAALASKKISFVMHSKAVLEIFELANLTTSFGDQVVLAND